MNEVDFYKLNVKDKIHLEKQMNFFEGLIVKGYVISDLGFSSLNGIYIGNMKYSFDEIDKVPVKENKLEEGVK
ncbi:hypothetical protein GW932_01845 [archaeon]|nr:hypothetical protein [archaeon]